MTNDGSDDEKNRRYQIGYGRPPVSTQFKKGQSGNPNGRPRGSGQARIDKLINQEFYRTMSVREGERKVRVPAIQLMLRGLVLSAAKGNVPALRTALQLAQTVEAAAPPTMATVPATSIQSRIDIARRVAFLLADGKAALDEENERKRRLLPQPEN